MRTSRRLRHQVLAVAVGLGLVGVPVVAAVPAAAAPSAPAARTGTSSTFNGSYQRISVSTSGAQANGSSDYSTISADGRLVTFTSEATNLVSGDTNGVNDLFIRDRLAGTTERINVSSSGEQANGEMGPYVDSEAVMSADGRFVAFNSKATNLVPGDTNNTSDIFVRDRVNGTTIRANTSASGAQGTQLSYAPDLSDDGTVLSFLSWSNLDPADTDGWGDIYRKDLTTGAIQLVSVDTGDNVRSVAQTPDGSKVAYNSGGHLLVRDIASGTSTEFPLGSGGTGADTILYVAGISPDGNRILFVSSATNIVEGDAANDDAFLADVSTGAVTNVSAAAGAGSVFTATMSADGSKVAIEAGSSVRVLDLDTGDVTIVPNDWSWWNSSMTPDGSTITMSSESPTRVPGDTNGVQDVFLANLDPSGDAAAPIVTCGGPDGAWHAVNETVNCTSTDLDSALANPADAAFTLTTQVADGTENASASTASRQVCDTAGNCRTAVSNGHKIDRKAPTITVPDAAKGTFVRGADVAAAYTCDDSGSGTASCTAVIGGEPVAAGDPLPTDSVVTSVIDVTGRDAVGNVAGSESPFKVVYGSLTGLVNRPTGQGAAGATVSLWPDGAAERSAWTTTASDGSFSFNIGDSGAGTFTIQITKAGYEDLWYGGADRTSADPVELGVRPVEIDVRLTAAATDDITPPVVQCTAPSTTPFYKDNVTVHCTADDDTALADPADGSFDLTTSVDAGQETTTAMVPARPVCDVSDNCASTAVYGPYKIDRKAPVVTIDFPSEGAQIPVGNAIYPSYQCTDLSGASCDSTHGLAWEALPNSVGPHSFTVTSQDGAGHTTSVTRNYTVVQTTITGRFYTYPTEAPISGALVELWAPWAPRTGAPTTTTSTSPNGAWTVSGLAPNTPYYVRLSKAGYQTIWHGGATTPESSTTVIGPAGGISTTYYDWSPLADSSPPTVSCSSPSPPTGTNGWYPANVSATCQVTDPSGLASGTPSPVVVSTNLVAGQESAAAPTSSFPVCDVYNNCTTVGPLTFKIDRKAPVVTCPASNTAWTVNEQSYTCTTADGGAGGQAPSLTLATSVGFNNASANASTNTVLSCDVVGNCTSAQKTGLKVDRAFPVANCPAVPTTWSASNLTLTCTPTDVGSGVVGGSTRLTSTTVPVGFETANASFQMFVLCDAANNCTFPQPSGAKVDRAPPSYSCAAPDTAWKSANVSLSCTHSDGGAGLPATYSPFPPFVVNVPYPTSFTVSTNVSAGTETASASATTTQKCDVLNNCVTPSIGGNKIDRKGPTTASCPAASSAWSATNVTVNCTAADGGSGLDSAAYSTSTNVSAGSETASATMGSVSMCDRVSNCSSLTASGNWKVDRRAPSATCTSAPDAGTVLDQNVSLSCLVSESGSGRSATTPSSFSLATSVADGAEETASTPSRPICDAVDNCSVVDAFGPYGIDRKAPSVAVASPAAGAYVQAGSPLLADYECTDLFLQDCTGDVADGAALPAGLGPHEFTVTGTDQAGHTTSVTRSYTVLPDDSAAPIVSCGTAPSGATWRSTEVSIACTVTDASPLADPAQASFSVSTSVGAGEESATATIAPVEVCDVFGHCASTSAYGPFKVDRKAPTAPCTNVPSSWVKANASARCTPADGGAGSTSNSVFNLVTTVDVDQWDGDASTTSKNLCDKVGNCSLIQVHHLQIDRAGPVVSCGSAPEAWSRDNLSVACTATDPGAGYTGPTSLTAVTALKAEEESSDALATANACDVVGNCTKKTVGGFKVDRKLPSLVCDGADTAWHTENLTFGCAQSDGGSGLRSTSPFGGAPTFEVSTAIGPGKFNANARALGPSPVCDEVGNCRNVAISGNKIDRKPPTAACPAADTAWHADNVTVTCLVADEGSGPVSPTLAMTTAVETGTEVTDAATEKGTYCDVAGNCVTITAPGRYKVDRKGPRATVNAPVAGSAIVLGNSVTVSYSCSDDGSGIGTCTGDLANGAPFTADALGAKTFTAEGVDAVGNRTTTTVTVQVMAPVSGRVVNPSGAGVAGVTISRYPANGDTTVIDTVTTDATGFFHFDSVPPGSYKFGATKPGEYLPRFFNSSTLAGAPAWTVDGVTPRVLGPLTITPAVTIGGTVVGPAGQPLAGVEVAVYANLIPTGAPIARITTDAEGRWRLGSLAAGTYRYSMTAPGYQTEWHLDATSKATSTGVPVVAGDTITDLLDQLAALP